MKTETAGREFSELETFWMCMRCYSEEVGTALHMLAFVFASIVTRGVLYKMISDIVFELEGSVNLLGAVKRIFMYRIGILVIEGLTTILFESSMCVFQAKTYVRSITNILGNEVPGRFDMTSGKSQYFISKGIEGLSKIVKVVFVDVVSRFIYVQIDLYRIYSNYGSRYLGIGLALLLVGLFIHVRGTFAVLRCRRSLNRARAQTDKRIYEILSNYETIKSYQTEEREAHVFQETILPWRGAFIHMKRVLATLEMAHSLLFRVAAFMTVAALCKYGQANGNRVRNMYSLIADYDKSVEDISSIYGKLRAAILNSTMVLQYLNKELGNRRRASIEYFHEALEFRNVDFALGEMSILKNLSFSIRKGEKVAVHGRNGAGKSTVFKLILRLLEPSHGSILIDGIPICSTTTRSYRSLFTYIPQQADLFDDTVYNNLRYGNDRSYGEIIEECRRLNIHDEILRLNLGYNTVVGESGRNVSGGLKQKIYCVRGLLRESFIYLFDEPINNLDEASANALTDIILDPKLSKKTFLVICHNMKTVERFSRHLVLE